MAEAKLQRMTVDEFFAWQAKQDKNYELVDGLPVLPLKAMTGASRAHDRVVVNIIATLHRQLRGSRCTPTTDDLAVRIPRGNIRRPDVTVECGKPDLRQTEVAEPRVVFEVLSPSTVSFDRVRKLAEYQSIPSMAHVLLIDTEQPRVDLWSREADGSWQPHHFTGLDAIIDLPAIGATLAMSEVFDGLTFDAA